MADINYVMWNCSGVLPTSSIEEKLTFLFTAHPNFDLLVLLETHHKDIDGIPIRLNTYRNTHNLLHTEADEDDPYGGIIVLVSKRFKILQEAVLIKGRLLNFKVKEPGTEHNISAFYGLTGNNFTRTNMKIFTTGLEEAHHGKEQNLILGDFNFVDNDLDRTSGGNLGKNQYDKNLSTPWLEFLAKLDLTDLFRNGNPNRRMYSYIHTQYKAKSRIDRVYMSDESIHNVSHYRHTPTPFIKAHRIVTFVLKKDGERGPGYWKMNTTIITDRAFEIVVETIINDVLSLNIADPIERWLVFIETIRIEARVYCSRKRYLEKKIKMTCEKNIQVLEQNKQLSQDPILQEEYDYNVAQLNEWNKKQIQGYQTRIKTQPKFEFGEPNISFFADLERKSAKKRCISQLKNNVGETKQTTEDMKEIAVDFYTDLFSRKKINDKMTKKLLNNVTKKLTPGEKNSMDREITLEELEKAVMKLQRGKSPGPDGIPVDFYQRFWSHIHPLYKDYINAIKTTTFPAQKNISITTLIYKDKGEKVLLKNYRPIALMNVDVKILTKLLSMRLKLVLPAIIHESQTAVYGRHIGDNINLVRDIIDLANKQDDEAALLFIDQEKAFDRVNHNVLYKILEKFGFGAPFIQWIKVVYSNASTQVNINGFLTDPIPLKSGVRQGCPLSALLYVLVIELLALQLRVNPNIVGFKINGEKIISSHYADDAVIKITQNRCFKEVYKDLIEYEKATGAKINLDKTKGLWIGRWKYRIDDPFEGLYQNKDQKIRWTSQNVKYLGIYVGNDNPSIQTFQEITPNIIRRLHFWKPLQLPILAKARVIEIFHASKLWYAASFYTIPGNILKELDEAFLDYIIFPKKKKEVSKMEMQKSRENGGIKLINIKLKSETPKVHWLLRMITDENLKTQFKISSTLIGIQKGNLSLRDIIFTDQEYIRKHLQTDSLFYQEALNAASRLNVWKHVPDIRSEHAFHNQIFTTTVEDQEDLHDRTIKPFQGNKTLAKIHTYGDLLDADIGNPKLKAVIRRKIESIQHIRTNVRTNLIIGRDYKEYEFSVVTHSFLYKELIYEQSRDHIYQTKWPTERDEMGRLDWDKIWDSVHNNFITEDVKSTIWEQIHLNFYTTYNYNKWHNTLNPCPLCNKIPEDIFHVILDCEFTKYLWKKLEVTILKIMPKALTIQEMAFGLQPSNKREKEATVLRNWATFSLRHHIMKEERKAYHRGYSHLAKDRFSKKCNQLILQDLKTKSVQYQMRGLQSNFDKIATVNNAISSRIRNDCNQYTWFDVL